MEALPIPVKAVFSMELKPSLTLLLGQLAFYDRQGKQIDTFVATSGQPGFQTPEHYRTRRKGLCPPYKGLEIVTAGYPLTTIGVEGMFYPILPDPIPGYGRSEIGLHRDANRPGSSGCVVVCNTESFNGKVVPLIGAAAKAGIKRIELEIDYRTENKRNSNEIDILARTIYGEARGEIELGQIAVGWVIKNRALAGGWWGDDIIEVCLKPYQFSCWNPNDPNRKVLEAVDSKNPLFARCLKIASGIVKGELTDPVKGANHYHARTISPFWAKGKKPIGVIGNHVFYKL